jgi:hypothetical protein
MLGRWIATGLVLAMASLTGFSPKQISGQTAHPGQIKYNCTSKPGCADLRVPVPPGSPPQWMDPSRPGMPPSERAIPPESTRPGTTPPDAAPPRTDTPPSVTPPDTMQDLTATPPDSALSFGTAETGIGSADVAFSGAPGMIGDQFGFGNGHFAVPMILGRAILHSDFVNGSPTQLGVNDFHLIDESLTPVGFAGGGGGSSFFFLVPPDFVFGRLPNGDPIQPGSVTGLQAFDLSLFGFPEGTTGVLISATQTPDQVTVQDQQSSDVFPGAPVYVITVGDGTTPLIVIPTANPSSGGVVVGRQKTAENTSPIPRDRVFMNYSYFDNTPLFPGGVDVNRFTPGFEKTFLGGNASLEARFPFATTLDSDISVGGFTDTSHLEFGNIYLALKGLLYQNNTTAFSAGLAMILPTGDDTRVNLFDGTPLVRVRNESVHLMPFLGGLYVPNDRFFAQGFVQFDFDANGNPVELNLFGNRLTRAGVANDATYMYLDGGLGYWLYRNPSGGSWLTGFAPTVELHYNRSLQSADVIQRGFYQVGSFEDQVQNLNGLIGATAVLGQNTTLTAAYVTGIGNRADQFFDGEARVSLNWYFGRSANALAQSRPLAAPFVR